MSYTYKITDDQVIEEYVTNQLGYRAIANKYGISQNAVSNRVKRLIGRNLIPKDIADSRIHRKKLPSDEVLKELYLEKGMGCLKIANLYGATHAGVRKKLHKLGIVDSSRQFKKKEGSRRSRRTAQHEFLVSTRRKRFEEVSGLCEECNKLIGDGSNYTVATYHHILPVAKGGDRSEGNCMVLHKECHNDPVIFEKLHGFDVQYLDNYRQGEDNA